MTQRLTIHTLDSAPEASRKPLAQAAGSLGFVPNLLGGLANSPAALAAYLGLAAQFSSSRLSPGEQQAVLLAVSAENGCDYCVAAHSMLAGKLLSVAQIAALRDGSSTGDPRIDALVRYTRHVVSNRGWIDDAELAAFEAAGFRREHALDVLVGVAQKILSNYGNHLIGTPLDAAFAGTRWQAPRVDAAA
jgi:uncharacterized peroxidase-related enzyme